MQLIVSIWALMSHGLEGNCPIVKDQTKHAATMWQEHFLNGVDVEADARTAGDPEAVQISRSQAMLASIVLMAVRHPQHSQEPSKTHLLIDALHSYCLPDLTK